MNSLGQHVLVGLSDTHLLDKERQLLRTLQPAGVILFRKNIDKSARDWRESLRQLLLEVREAISREQVLYAIDHEGGLVHRLYEPVTRFPSAFHWGAQVAEVGSAMGRELRALGFNLNFAPALDVWSEPQNTVIGKRAFSTVAQECANAGIAFAEAMQAQGVLACGKHFAGHGATLLDSHFALPELSCSTNLMMQRELIPFVEYINAGYPLLMTSHVRYTAIDSNYPASLSPEIITSLLRNQLGFSGCVITDDLEMKALAQFGGSEIATRAITAGSDILLEGNPAEGLACETMQVMVQGIADALDAGTLSEQVITDSQQRIKELFSYLEHLQNHAPVVEPTAIGCDEHRRLATALSPE